MARRVRIAGRSDPNRRQRRIADPAKVQGLAERSSADKDLAITETIAYVIAHGWSGLRCLLTEEQYRRLTQ